MCIFAYASCFPRFFLLYIFVGIYDLFENAFKMTKNIFREIDFGFQKHLKCFLKEASGICLLQEALVHFQNLLEFLLRISFKTFFVILKIFQRRPS